MNGVWSEDEPDTTSNFDVVDCCMYGGLNWRVSATDEKKCLLYSGSANYTDDITNFTFEVSSPWIRLDVISGFQRVYWAGVEGTSFYASNSNYINYYTDFSSSVVDSCQLVSVDSGTRSMRLKPSKQRCTASKIVYKDGGSSKSYLSGFVFIIGTKGGLYRQSIVKNLSP